MKYFNSFVFIFAGCLSVAVAIDYSPSLVGHQNPDGYIKFCSMYSNPTKVTPASLKKLFLSVKDVNGYVTPYNYYNVTNLVKHPDIDLKKKTFVWVGSYLDVNSIPIGEAVGGQYKKLGYNVLLLHFMEAHWRNFFIPTAAQLMRPIGKHAAEMLANLTSLGLDPKKLELVGYGLGGQTMSFVAKNYREITGQNISMLVGLDPAGSCFRTLGPDERLDPSDADFVLSIATNMDSHGIATPVGHVTFYVNGGEHQYFDVWFIPCDLECSHFKSILYWLAALINPGKYIGMKCDTIQHAREHNCYDRRPMETNTMDLKVDKSKPGIYYIVTSYRYPYALGKAGLSRANNPIFNMFNAINGPEVMRIDV